MAVNTDLYRHLSARWLVRESLANKMYCGLSKNIITNFNEHFNDVSNAINECEAFLKLDTSFVEQTNNIYSTSILTKQIYNSNELVNTHSFLDNIIYWENITESQALELKSYNTIASFIVSNDEVSLYSIFENIRSIYFFYNLRINGELPSLVQIIPTSGDIISAEGIVLIENVEYVYQNVDNGVCEQKTNGISIIKGSESKINYFISF